MIPHLILRSAPYGPYQRFPASQASLSLGPRDRGRTTFEARRKVETGVRRLVQHDSIFAKREAWEAVERSDQTYPESELDKHWLVVIEDNDRLKKVENKGRIEVRWVGK